MHLRHLARVIVALILLVPVASASERHWQTGTWIDVSVKRRMVDFGPGSSPFGNSSGRPTTPSMRAQADIRTYVIETDDVRLELEEVAKVNTRSIDAVVGLPVTFALEKNTVYVRDSDEVEHKLKVTKKITKPR